MIIRLEQAVDVAGIRQVNEAAFGRPDEGVLVDALRAAGAVIASLVAEEEGEIIGHILFSPATLDSHSQAFGHLATHPPDAAAAPQANAVTPETRRPIAALGPMAVAPAHQRRGVGSQLIVAGLELCRAAGYDLVIVLGHTDYYPRFGFRPAPPLGIRWEHGADAHFMVQELQPRALDGASGVVRYRPEFDNV